jgi:hypothetical protein
MLSAYGASAIAFMIVMYALEPRGSLFILGFAVACLAASTYAFLAGTWPFGIAEIVWAFVAARRYRRLGRCPSPRP